jgi:phosphoribosylaminoimidazolecarboxamide formyltransferase/IMP cyclohydrolase
MPVRTALVSVSDKTNLIPFVRALADKKVRILSSGGTAKALAAEGVPVETVESYTGSPEVMDGRVKTSLAIWSASARAKSISSS